MSSTAATLEQLRDLPDEELHETLARMRDELFRLQLGRHTNQVTSSAALETKRRDIARVLTVLRGRELGVEKQGQQSKKTQKAKAKS